MRQLIGVGTPRALQGRLIAIITALLALIGSLSYPVTTHRRWSSHFTDRSLLDRELRRRTQRRAKDGFHHGLLG
jgi:hypothetical protein